MDHSVRPHRTRRGKAGQESEDWFHCPATPTLGRYFPHCSRPVELHYSPFRSEFLRTQTLLLTCQMLHSRCHSILLKRQAHRPRCHCRLHSPCPELGQEPEKSHCPGRHYLPRKQLPFPNHPVNRNCRLTRSPQQSQPCRSFPSRPIPWPRSSREKLVAQVDLRTTR
jgi:hypothetical protein